MDVKGELWENVGKHRKHAMRFSITDPHAFGFDPFEPLHRGANLHDTCVQIAQQLVPENPNEKDPYWTEASQNLLTAALLVRKFPEYMSG